MVFGNLYKNLLLHEQHEDFYSTFVLRTAAVHKANSTKASSLWGGNLFAADYYQSSGRFKERLICCFSSRYKTAWVFL